MYWMIVNGSIFVVNLEEIKKKIQRCDCFTCQYQSKAKLIGWFWCPVQILSDILVCRGYSLKSFAEWAGIDVENEVPVTPTTEVLHNYKCPGILNTFLFQ